MAQIAVDLVTKNQLSPEAEKASRAMARLAAEEAKVQRIAKQLGTSDLKGVSRAIGEAERVEKGRVAKALADAKKLAAAEEKARKLVQETKRATENLDRKKQEGARKAIDFTDKLIKGQAVSSASLGVTAFAAVGLASAFVSALTGATALTGKIVQMAAAVGANRQAAQTMFSILEGGAEQGARALSLVDQAAVRMGVPIEKARERFISFRQAGADNKISAGLLKLTADLDAIDPSGKAAEQAIKKVLAHKGKDGALDIAAAREEMTLLAKQAGVAGDGATAVAARFGTLGGALRSIDNSKTEILEKIWERIGPTVDRVAGKVAKLIDEFVNSEEGAEAVEKIARGVEIAGVAIEKIVPIALGFVGAIASAIEVGTTLAAGLFLLPEAFGAVGGAITETLSSFFGLSEGVAGAITRVVAAILDPLGLVSEGMPSLASDMIDGLIAGLDPSRLFAKVAGIASGVADKFAGVLGIKSPSTVFRAMGEDTGEGYEQGFEKSIPDSGDVAEAMIPPAPQVTGGTSQASAPVAVTGGGEGIGTLVVNVYGKEGAEEIAQSVRRAVDEYLTARQQSQGLAA